MTRCDGCRLDNRPCPGEAVHCANGRHCTSQWAECAAARSADDHANKCCNCGNPLFIGHRPLRPEGAPRLGETYQDWRDFTERVARPWVENDGDDEQVDKWYASLMLGVQPWYLAVALVMADNRIRELEAHVSDGAEPSESEAIWPPASSESGRKGAGQI